mgnify:CR=1 FL=1
MEITGEGVQKAETKCQPIIRIWIDMERKIASFHSITEQSHFCCYNREQFMSYTFALIEDGFRFM